jgi:hypothetical protein
MHHEIDAPVQNKMIGLQQEEIIGKAVIEGELKQVTSRNGERCTTKLMHLYKTK